MDLLIMIVKVSLIENFIIGILVEIVNHIVLNIMEECLSLIELILVELYLKNRKLKGK